MNLETDFIIADVLLTNSFSSAYPTIPGTTYLTFPVSSLQLNLAMKTDAVKSCFRLIEPDNLIAVSYFITTNIRSRSLTSYLFINSETARSTVTRKRPIVGGKGPACSASRLKFCHQLFTNSWTIQLPVTRRLNMRGLGPSISYDDVVMINPFLMMLGCFLLVFVSLCTCLLLKCI